MQLEHQCETQCSSGNELRILLSNNVLYYLILLSALGDVTNSSRTPPCSNFDQNNTLGANQLIRLGGAEFVEWADSYRSMIHLVA
jgi:hypothetical protein